MLMSSQMQAPVSQQKRILADPIIHCAFNFLWHCKFSTSHYKTERQTDRQSRKWKNCIL